MGGSPFIMGGRELQDTTRRGPRQPLNKDSNKLVPTTYAGLLPEVKQQIVAMAMNASGIRDTARVLHVSPTTVLKELKKRRPTSNK
jgi:transposase-like protein